MSLLDAFFKQSQIQTVLAMIADKDISGWEKWWQIELALFLSEHDDVAEWDMEEPFFTDLRHDTSQDSLAIDLCFRRKRHSTERLIFLELKQDQDWKRCVANMLSDAEKVYSAQSKSVFDAEIRNFFLAGIYISPNESKAEIHDYIEKVTESRDVEWELMETRFIANTPYSFTLL
ncbi:MAG: hypothetical protein AABY96_09690 [Nitrospirota bacterium]